MLKIYRTSEIISCNTCKREWEIHKGESPKGPQGRVMGTGAYIKLHLCSNCMGHYCKGCFEASTGMCCECHDMRKSQAS